ncbi:hypothetical protein [Streptomyces sp. ISL-100]|uniref:hypothetical protein n=1 Tax=Streptomyces sp. ISL-100 TaxID=2819173 RepID=UPI001BEC6525|nr:hypothetical protein [Streptomyces sp. ISL-100]MBT2394881.1 hypothetical protein [Streptomyces sp. ISL-100]
MKLRSAATAAALNLLVLGSAASAQAAGPEQVALSASDTVTKTSVDLAHLTERQTEPVLGPGPVVDTDTFANTTPTLGLNRQNMKQR